MISSFRRTLAGFALVLLVVANPLARGAEPTVPLGRAGDFAVLAGSFVTNSGATVIGDNVGVWPGTAVFGFPPGVISGTIHTGNVAAADAQTDLTIAYDDAAARSTAPVTLAGDIGGQTLTPGLYRSTASLDIASGDLTLNGQSNSAAVFIFQIPSTFSTAAGRRVIVTGGARSARIFWQVGDSATLGSGSITRGNILANQSITIQSGATLDGRALARAGAVSLDTSSVRTPSGGAGPSPPGVIAVGALSPITLNPQTGLLEQTITLRNAGSNAVAAAQLVLRALPPGVTVHNATGARANGRPYLQYNRPIPVGGTVEFAIEYFRANRQFFTSPIFAAIANTPTFPPLPVGVRQPVVRKVFLGAGRMLVEFKAERGRSYAVQYSDDGRTWKTARPLIAPKPDRVLWLDSGPPGTESKPTVARSYRVLKLS